MARIPIALQMYTVREEAELDFIDTLDRVAELGYVGVELAGTGGLKAVEFKAIVDDLGLRIAGAHVSLALLETELDESLDYYSQLGVKHITCPWLPENRRQTGDQYRTLAQSLNLIGAAASGRGIQLCYHNHAFEFERFEGEMAFDILFDETSPSLVKIELDTYWAEFAGVSAIGIMEKYAGRIPMLHLKDMTNDDERTFAEVGEGTMDFESILAASGTAGVEWLIVEQDKCKRPALESAEISLRNLQKLVVGS